MSVYVLRLFVIIVAFLLNYLPGQVTAGEEAPKASDIVGVGKETSGQIFQYLSEQYEKTGLETRLFFQPLEEQEAIRRLAAGQVDYMILDSGESDFATPQVTGKIIMLPVIADAVALVYNLPGLEGDLRLSRRVYTDIFTGQIRNWNDERIARLNPDLSLPNLEITTVHRSEPSHTTRVFTRHLNVIGEEWRKSGIGVGKQVDWPGPSMAERRNAGVATKVQRSYGSIGYVDFSTAKRGGLPVAILENSIGEFVAPSAETTWRTMSNLSAANLEELIAQLVDPPGITSYPIIVCRWAVIPKQSPDRIKATKVISFLEWLITSDQLGLETFGYSPLPEQIRKLALSELKKAE